MSALRLLKAVRCLWNSTKKNNSFWFKMEMNLMCQNKFVVFRLIHKHMGNRKRVLMWSSYLEAPCTLCHLPLFQCCTSTFPLNLKLCNNCKEDHIITEQVISRYVPYYIVLNMRNNVRYCFLSDNNNHKIRSYYRPAVLRYLHYINVF